MKSFMIAGVCLLVLLGTIAECSKFDVLSKVDPKQYGDCDYDVFTAVVNCAELLDGDYYDDDYFDDFCRAGCDDILLEYLECADFPDYYIDDARDQLEEVCGSVAVGAISAVTAVLVAIAAALN